MDPSERLARRFQALAVPTRMRILALLDGRSLCVGALAGKLDVTQGAVSQHLRILKDAGFVNAERQGTRVHYSLSEDALTEWGAVLERVFEQYAPPAQDQGEMPCAHRGRHAGPRRR